MHGIGGRMGLVALAWALAACGDDGDTTTGFTSAPLTTGATTPMTTSTDPSTGEPTTTAAPTEPTTEATTTSAGVCGDGVPDPGEQCDDGMNNADDGACTLACATAVCGDGLVRAGGEGCDDGNTEPGDGCGADCIPESCGDGKVDAGEQCDDGNPLDDDACLVTCQDARCGDGIVHAGAEACDDGNADDADACRDTCVAAACGDGVVWLAMEACDDGNVSDADLCTAKCQLPTCDDEQVDGDETDADCGGATCPKCAVGKKCAAASDCASALCTAGLCAPPSSCKQILAADPMAASGKYTIDPDAAGPLQPFSAFCDMTTDGGGWTIFYAATGADAEFPLISDAELTLNNPLMFQHYNLNLARKIALSQGATATIFVRPDNVWLRADKPLFDATVLVANTTSKFAVNLAVSDGTTAAGFMGWANFNYTGGGDFGITAAPDGPTCNGVTVAGFDHHGNGYHMLNCGCQRQYIYSYSGSPFDSDAGYDVNTALGAWSATQACAIADGGSLQFHAAMR